VVTDLRTNHGATADSDILVIGDDGTQVTDVLTAFPSATSVVLMEHVASQRALATTTHSGNGKVTVVDPATYDFSGNAAAFDVIICTFVLCRYPEYGNGPVLVADFKACVDQMFALLKIGGLLLVGGSNYCLKDYLPTPCNTTKLTAYVSHVPVYDIDGTDTQLTSQHGMFVAQKLDTNTSLDTPGTSVSGTGSMCVPSTVVAGDVLAATAIWSNFPTGRMKLELTQSSGEVYLMLVIRANISMNTYSIYLNHKTAANVFTFIYYTNYNSTTNPMTNLNEFRLEISKTTSTTSRCRIYNGNSTNSTVFFEQTITDHDPSSLTDISDICLNSYDGASFSYTITKT
jgi:hypothetical protein